jgi:hypothetical protein
MRFDSMRYTHLLVVLGLLAGAGPAKGDPPVRDARALAARIDELIEARLAKRGVPAAPRADDAEFFRRLSLDLNGRIPTVAQVRDFLDDPRPDKRRLWVEELLTGRDNAPLFVNHLGNVYRRRLLAHTPPPPSVVVAPLEAWLRKQVKANTPYDRLVRGLLTDPSAEGFFQANQNRAENLAARTARLFLGVRLECAQCHDHPFATWKRKQFWELAAFFAGLRKGELRTDAVVVVRPRPQKPGPGRIRIGNSDTWVEPRFPDGTLPVWKPGARPREVLAGWLTDAKNPAFARAAVNVVWHQFFGVGLVEPADDMGATDNPPSHPELLDELARQFVLHRFDVKYLIEAITASGAYQRTSRQTDPGQKDARTFARAALRGLSPEQLFDSVVEATGYRPASPTPSAYGGVSPRAEFLAAFDDPHGQPAEFQATIQQALVMMNGKFVEEASRPERSPNLAAVLRGKAPAARIEELYLLTLSRRPRPEEAKRLLRYAEGGGKEALRDIFWALLNSTEFVVNH